MGILLADNQRHPVAERVFGLPSGIALHENQIEEVSAIVVAEIEKAGRQ